MMDPSEIERLLTALQDGDENARNDLIAFVCERLRALTRRMLRNFPVVRNNEQTDDVLQNAMIRLHRSLEKIQPETPLHFYNLATQQIRWSLIDMARRYMRQGHIRHFSDASGAAEGDASSADSWPDIRNEPSDLESWTAFHEAVETLPAPEREVFGFLWYEEQTLEDAAKVLNVSVSTVKRRWQSARLLLQATQRARGEGR